MPPVSHAAADSEGRPSRHAFTPAGLRRRSDPHRASSRRRGLVRRDPGSGRDGVTVGLDGLIATAPGAASSSPSQNAHAPTARLPAPVWPCTRVRTLPTSPRGSCALDGRRGPHATTRPTSRISCALDESEQRSRAATARPLGHQCHHRAIRLTTPSGQMQRRRSSVGATRLAAIASARGATRAARSQWLSIRSCVAVREWPLRGTTARSPAAGRLSSARARLRDRSAGQRQVDGVC